MAKKSVDKMTKAELLREVKRLQKRVDKLERAEQPRNYTAEELDAILPDKPPAPKFPWNALPNAFEGAR
jgi:hypothetical protein